MTHMKAWALGAVSVVALAIAPVAPAAADHFHGGFHHFGLGGVAGAVVGLATLPLEIAAAALEPRGYGPEYAEPQGYAPPPAYYAPAPAYYPPPVYYGGAPRYYGPGPGYYGRPGGHYAPRSGYNARYGREAAPRQGHYYNHH